MSIYASTHTFTLRENTAMTVVQEIIAMYDCYMITWDCP